MDLTSLSPEQLLHLKTQLDGLTDTSGRSPFRPRQLHDLTKQPGAKDPRPLFVWSADQPLDFVPSQTLYGHGRLMWSAPDRHGKQTEICVYSEAEFQEKEQQGYQSHPPLGLQADPMDAIQDAFDALSPADQQLMLQAQAQDKRNRLQATLASLSEADLERLVAGMQEPEKRKPGRPRKAVV